MNWPRLKTRPATRRRRSWQPSVEEVEARQLFSSAPLCVLGTDGNRWQEAPGWQTTGRTFIDGNVKAFAAVGAGAPAAPSGAGDLYVEGTYGILWLEGPNWQSSGRTRVDGNVQAFAVDPQKPGDLYVEGTDHNLWLEAPGWQQ